MLDKKVIIFLILFIFILKTQLLSRYYQLRKGKEYINKCLESINFNKNSYLKNTNPKVSVVVPIFNCEDSIKSSITSIQNQRLKEIEIVLVNDFSLDNSKDIIERMQKEDPRIVIINNNQNRGTLYSRNVGALYASGKYILCLDNDDMFINDNLISKLYNMEEKYDYDIIGFKIINGYSYNEDISNMFDDPFITKKNDKIVFQPDLKYLSLTNNDCHIWGKSIKNEIYKNAISLLGYKRSNTYLCNAEDDVIVLMIFNVAKSFRFIPFYGLFHLISKKTAAYTLPKNHILFSKLFFLDLLFDFTGNNTEEKQYVFDNAILIKNFLMLKNITFNRRNKIYLKKFLKKVFKCPYISKKNKKILKNIF